MSPELGGAPLGGAPLGGLTGAGITGSGACTEAPSQASGRGRVVGIGFLEVKVIKRIVGQGKCTEQPLTAKGKGRVSEGHTGKTYLKDFLPFVGEVPEKKPSVIGPPIWIAKPRRLKKLPETAAEIIRDEAEIAARIQQERDDEAALFAMVAGILEDEDY